MLAQARIGRFSPPSLGQYWVDRTGLGDAQFDLTFCVDVVHHLNNRIGVSRKPIACLSQAVRCARQPIPKTSSGPVSLSRFTGPKRLEAELARYPHVKTLRAELREAGFVRLSALEVGISRLPDRFWPLPGKSRFLSAFSSLKNLPTGPGAAWKPTLFKGSVFTSKYMLLWLTRIAIRDLEKHTNRGKAR